MSDLTARCLDAFPRWLSALNRDARALGDLVMDEAIGPETRRAVARGLNYVFKSLDLIPDGIEDLGFLDDAFVLRVSARQALDEGAQEPKALEVLAPFIEEADLLRDFLGADYARLEAHVQSLGNLQARGRGVDAIVQDLQERQRFVADVHAWANSFVEPTFRRDPKTLVKLKAFLNTRLGPTRASNLSGQ